MQCFFRCRLDFWIVAFPNEIDFGETCFVFAVGNVADVFDKVMEHLINNCRVENFLDNVPCHIELFAHFGNLVVNENLRSLRNGVA